MRLPGTIEMFSRMTGLFSRSRQEPASTSHIDRDEQRDFAGGVDEDGDDGQRSSNDVETDLARQTEDIMHVDEEATPTPRLTTNPKSTSHSARSGARTQQNKVQSIRDQDIEDMMFEGQIHLSKNRQQSTWTAINMAAFSRTPDLSVERLRSESVQPCEGDLEQEISARVENVGRKSRKSKRNKDGQGNGPSDLDEDLPATVPTTAESGKVEESAKKLKKSKKSKKGKQKLEKRKDIENEMQQSDDARNEEAHDTGLGGSLSATGSKKKRSKSKKLVQQQLVENGTEDTEHQDESSAVQENGAEGKNGTVAGEEAEARGRNYVQSQDDDRNAMASMLNSATKRSFPITASSATALPSLGGTTPQVVIKSRPRPSLISITHSQDAGSRNPSHDPSRDEGFPAAAEETLSPIKESSKSIGKRKAVELLPSTRVSKKARKSMNQKSTRRFVENSSTNLRSTTSPLLPDSRGTLGTLSMAGKSAEAVLEPQLPVPVPTRGIIPAADPVRLRSSRSQQNSQTPASSSVIASSASSFADFPQNSSNDAVGPTRTAKRPAGSSLVRQSTLNSYVTRNGDVDITTTRNGVHNLQVKPKKVSLSTQVQASGDAVNEDTRLFISDDDTSEHEYEDLYSAQEDTPSRPSKKKVKSKRENENVHYSQPDEQTLSENHSSALLPAPDSIAKSLKSTAIAGKKQSSVSQRKNPPQTPRSSQQKIKIRTTFPSLEHSDVQTIEEAVENFRQHQELSNLELNALIQKSTKASGEMGKQLFEEVCSQVPDVPTAKVMKFCRRRFHNFIRGSWSQEQDEELREAYEQFPNKWTVISEMINRSADDARCRWRDYLVCGDAKKKDAWSLDEEDDLRTAYESCLDLIRAEKAGSKRRESPGASDEDLIDWQMVSVAMGKSRSRIQCMQKWKSMQKREAEEHNYSLAPVSETPWRFKRAVAETRTFSTDDKLRIFQALRECRAASENKIPWRNVSKDLDMSGYNVMAMKLLLRNVRAKVPDHRNMDLRDILATIIYAFEAAAPNEPVNFDVIFSESRVYSSPRRLPRTALRDIQASGKSSKRYSAPKPRVRPASLADPEVEMEDVPILTQKSSRKVRDRMRGVNQANTQDSSQDQMEADGENLADELKMVWTQLSATPKAKQPIFKPKVTQRRKMRPNSAYEESVSSPPSNNAEVEPAVNDVDVMHIDESPNSPLLGDSSVEDVDRTSISNHELSESPEDDMSDDSRHVNGFMDLEAEESEGDDDVTNADNEVGGDIPSADDLESQPESGNADSVTEDTNDHQSDTDSAESAHHGVESIKAAMVQEDPEGDDNDSQDDEISNGNTSQGVNEEIGHEDSVDMDTRPAITTDDVEIKEEDISDSEVISSIQKQPTFASRYEEDDALGTSSEPSEEALSGESQHSGFHVVYEEHSDLEDEADGSNSTNQRSPSSERFGSRSLSLDEIDRQREKFDNTNGYHASNARPYVPAPNISRAGSATNSHRFPISTSSKTSKSAQQSHNGFVHYHSGSVEEEESADILASMDGKSYGEGYAYDEDEGEHYITMKGWTPQAQRTRRIEDEPPESQSDDDDDKDDDSEQESLHNSIPEDPGDYAASPDHSESEDESDNDEISDEMSDPSEQKNADQTAGLQHAQWVWDRNVSEENDDSDSDVSSILAVAPPKKARQASVEL